MLLDEDSVIQYTPEFGAHEYADAKKHPSHPYWQNHTEIELELSFTGCTSWEDIHHALDHLKSIAEHYQNEGWEVTDGAEEMIFLRKQV